MGEERPGNGNKAKRDMKESFVCFSSLGFEMR